MPFSKIIYKASAQATPETWMDSTPATAAAADILAPKTALLANGVLTTGTGTGGDGDTYTRTVIAPQQTVTPDSSRQAVLTHTGVFEDGEYYIVTLDGVEWLTSCETLWTDNYVVGEAQIFLNSNFDSVYPFAGATYQGSVEFAFKDTNQHTVKVEHLEFVDGPLNLIEKSITANGTYNASSDNADGYSSVTVNVSGGGGAEEKDVNFIDYDGTILYSYTAADFASLSALPANPSHTGLTAQGWNWSLSDAKTYVASYGKLWIGQMYTTSDGKTRIYIHIPDDTPSEKRTMYVRFTQTVANGVTVDWGDGTTEQTYSGTSASNRSHSYASNGDYMITLDVTDGKVSFVGTSSNTIFGSTSNSYNRARIYKIEFGKNVTSIGDYALDYCFLLESVTIPQGITSIGNYAAANCTSLKSFTVPLDVTSIGNNVLYYCYSLKYVSFASSVTSIGTYVFQYDVALSSITYPSKIATIGTYAHNYCYLMKSIVIPTGVTSIDASAFSSCYLLREIVIPSSVTNIGNNAFATDYSINIVRFLPTTPPTCGTTLFSSISTGTIIYVPYSADHSILNAYKTATNLSTYASYMQEEPQ